MLLQNRLLFCKTKQSLPFVSDNSKPKQSLLRLMLPSADLMLSRAKDFIRSNLTSKPYSCRTEQQSSNPRLLLHNRSSLLLEKRLRLVRSMKLLTTKPWLLPHALSRNTVLCKLRTKLEQLQIKLLLRLRKQLLLSSSRDLRNLRPSKSFKSRLTNTPRRWENSKHLRLALLYSVQSPRHLLRS